MNNRRSARRRRVRDCGFCQDDVDKISAVEYQKLFSLIEVIYTHTLFLLKSSDSVKRIVVVARLITQVKDNMTV